MEQEQFRQDIVFGNKWFEKHQSRLLFLLNNKWTKRWFRYCLRIRQCDCKLDTIINKISPNSFSYGGKWIDDERIEITTDFRSGDKYSKRLYFAFKPFWYLLHFFDWAILDRIEYATKLSFGFSTLTVYSGSIGTDNPIAADARRSSVNETFSTIQTSAGTGVNYGGSSYNIYMRVACSGTSNQFSMLSRGIVCFDTSALTAGATISAVVLSLYPQNQANDLYSPNLHIGASTPANTNAIANGDYNQCQQVSFGSIAYASWNPASPAYRDITLDANGRANVSKTGISKFSLQLDCDINNSAPAWSSSIAASLNAQGSGAPNPPKLVVTYTVPVGPANLKTYNTNVKANIKSINTNLIANVKTLNTNV